MGVEKQLEVEVQGTRGELCGPGTAVAVEHAVKLVVFLEARRLVPQWEIIEE